MILDRLILWVFTMSQDSMASVHFVTPIIQIVTMTYVIAAQVRLLSYISRNGSVSNLKLWHSKWNVSSEPNPIFQLLHRRAGQPVSVILFFFWFLLVLFGLPGVVFAYDTVMEEDVRLKGEEVCQSVFAVISNYSIYSSYFISIYYLTLR